MLNQSDFYHQLHTWVQHFQTALTYHWKWLYLRIASKFWLQLWLYYLRTKQFHQHCFYQLQFRISETLSTAIPEPKPIPCLPYLSNLYIPNNSDSILLKELQTPNWENLEAFLAKVEFYQPRALYGTLKIILKRTINLFKTWGSDQPPTLNDWNVLFAFIQYENKCVVKPITCASRDPTYPILKWKKIFVCK
jgi:hypothetical protein